MDEPIKRVVKPYLRRNMERASLHGRDNLCSTIRDVYLDAKERKDEPTMARCCLAMRMSKNMYNALKVYKEMLMEQGIKVDHDTREDWQLRGRGRGT